MSTDIIKTENKEFVLARVRLAQAILEESDLLEGFSGYDLDSERWWVHPRHEREALVAYLLLTCFDRLGQERRFATISDWLKSKKTCHQTERNSVLALLSPNAEPLEVACKLANHYQSLYGVKNAFCQGIESLPEESRQQLFSSVTLSFNPEYGKHGPNVSTPSVSLEDLQLETDLKLKYLYGKRNGFTHRLEQYQKSSTPFAMWNESWVVEIRNETLRYWGCQQDVVPRESGGAYVFTISDWPFVLFEVLYSAIGLEFDRTSINLKFHVRFMDSARPHVIGRLDGIEHSRLRDFRSLARDFWAEVDRARKEKTPSSYSSGTPSG